MCVCNFCAKCVFEVLFRKLKHNARFSFYNCLQYCNIDLGTVVGAEFTRYNDTVCKDFALKSNFLL